MWEQAWGTFSVPVLSKLIQLSLKMRWLHLFLPQHCLDRRWWCNEDQISNMIFMKGRASRSEGNPAYPTLYSSFDNPRATNTSPLLKASVDYWMRCVLDYCVCSLEGLSNMCEWCFILSLFVRLPGFVKLSAAWNWHMRVCPSLGSRRGQRLEIGHERLLIKMRSAGAWHRLLSMRKQQHQQIIAIWLHTIFTNKGANRDADHAAPSIHAHMLQVMLFLSFSLSCTDAGWLMISSNEPASIGSLFALLFLLTCFEKLAFTPHAILRLLATRDYISCPLGVVLRFSGRTAQSTPTPRG